MYGQCLITPTILDSFEFAVGAPQTWKERAEIGFLAKLRREEVDYPAWVKAGQDFEDTVYRVCNAHRNDQHINQGSTYFQHVANKCNGGRFQTKLSKKIDIDGEKVFLFGYTDVMHTDLIIDLKTTLNYKGPDKYLNGAQHLLYTYITGIKQFEYIVAQWTDKHTSKIQAVHEISYNVPHEDFVEVEITIYNKIEAFFNYLRENKLWNDYYTIFSKN